MSNGTILLETHALINAERQDDYGTPLAPLRQYLESARKRWGSIVKAHGEPSEFPQKEKRA